MMLLIFLKNGINELIKQKESHSYRKQIYGHQGGKQGGINWGTGMDILTLLCIDK